MSFNLLWVCAIAFSYAAGETNEELWKDPFGGGTSKSLTVLDVSVFGDVGKMIAESQSLVMNILRVREPDQISDQIKPSYPQLTEFFRRVSQSVSQCLKKDGSQSERILNAAVCFTEAVRNRQNEDEDDVPPARDCLQEAMIESATKAAQLTADADEAYQRFRHVVTDTGRKMMMCRGDVRPIDCVRTIWAEAMTEMAELRNETAAMVYRAQELYVTYIDSMRYCLTPVEEPDEEEADENNEQKETTDGSKCSAQNEYDSVDPDRETRVPVNNCDDVAGSPDASKLS